MASTSMSATIEKIREEATVFESRDLLLCFSQKNKFQSPLLIDYGDQFYETWLKEIKPRTLASFFPISSKYDEEHQKSDLENFRKVLKSKKDDFCDQDLYLATGFVKWGEKTLAPALLIPLDYNYDYDTVAISARTPIENIAIQSLDTANKLPIAFDFVRNDKFDIKKFFDTLEKRIATKTDWKFTRNGCCITFYSTNKLLLKKTLSNDYWATSRTANNSFFNATIGNDGFLPQPSLFEETTYDHVFNPADHYFPYTTDSQTNKAAIDALNEQATAYAIQTLPGTDKSKLAVNIVADLIQQKKKVCVISRRAITKLNFETAWKPPFRSFQSPERDTLQKVLNDTRANFVAYNDIVNYPLQPSGAKLTELLDEMSKLKQIKSKFPSEIFKNIEKIPYPKYKSMLASLKQMTRLFFEQNGIEVYDSFYDIKMPAFSLDRKNSVGEDLEHAKELIEKIKPFLESTKKSNLFPCGLKLADLPELINLFKKSFDKDLPGFEDWNLHSNGWMAYQDDLMDLPNAGSRWSNYRRRGSEVYTDNAIDENVFDARNEFVDSLSSTLRSLSDHYRRPKRFLLTVFKNPKSITSDEMLVEKIDALIELQDCKHKYKDSSVLAMRLFGKDWKFEKTDWKELSEKIHAFYSFRAKNKNSEDFDHLVHVLEQWHIFRPFVDELDDLLTNIDFLQKNLQTISKSLNFEESIDEENVDTWMEKIESWSSHWNEQDIYLQLCEHMDNISDSPCENLANFVRDSKNANVDISMAFARTWTSSQMHAVTAKCPGLFTTTSKNRKQKSAQYRALLDQFSNANFREAHNFVEKHPNLLQSIALSKTYESNFGSFDVALFLDADCMTIAEAMPGIYNSKKAILFGNPCSPSLEPLPMDACDIDLSQQSIFFKDNMLSAALRKGIPTRVIGYTSQYADSSLFDFANKNIYNNEIVQFSNSTLPTVKLHTIKMVRDKVFAVAEHALLHAAKNPSQTLGIVTFSQALSDQIESELQKMLEKYPAHAKFFTQGNLQNKFYIKTVERAVDLYRDVIFICPDIESVSSATGNRKLSICTTLAKQKMSLFMTEDDSYKLTNSKPSLFHEWVNQLNSKAEAEERQDDNIIESILNEQIKDVFKTEGIPYKESIAHGGIPIGPVVLDAYNTKRFLAVIETDSCNVPYKESVEDREYLRPNTLTKFGWNIFYIWLPQWNISHADEKGNLITTIAIEQSVAPPQQESEDKNEDEDSQSQSASIEPYVVENPAIEGTTDDLPILELSAEQIIQQLKFYVDHESPIHSELLLQRILDLHHIDRVGPKMSSVLSETIKQALHEKQFIKTGSFFYSLTNKDIKLRDRSKRPDSERKLAYISPEERALFKSSFDEHTIKQALGVV